MSDPVCHIPPVNQPANPTSHQIPGLPGPVTPPTSGSNAALLAAMNNYAQLLNALLTMVRKMSGQNVTINNTTVQGGSGTKASQWNETGRTTDKVKIYQNNDPKTGNFVEVDQINSLTMTDKNTGQTWRWSR